MLYATDPHSSEKTFRKFVNALKLNLYDAKIGILDGDLAGKAIVPIIQLPNDRFFVHFLGRKEECGKDELPEMKKRIRNMGFFTYECTSGEVAEFESDSTRLQKLFEDLLRGTMKGWVELADERLGGSDVQMYMMPGNDDPAVVEEVLASSRKLVNPDGKVIRIDGAHEMISCGHSNPTPWKTPREVSEEELLSKIEAMAEKVSNMGNCIFNVHVPPYNSSLDMAPKLDSELRPQATAGDVLKTPVGSTAVRSAIEKYQPLLGLHGHVHESAGEVHLGRTLCLNPGTEYSEGLLDAYVVQINDRRVENYVRVSG